MDSNTILFYVIILIGIVAYGYFLIYRPRKKQTEQRKKQMEAQKRGDEIITVGGIYGTIDVIEENSVVIKLESGGTMRIARMAIAGKVSDILPPGSAR
jgi:preprotein translocase subunit YajC